MDILERVKELEAENAELKEKIESVISWSKANQLASGLSVKWGKTYVDACMYAENILTR